MKRLSVAVLSLVVLVALTTVPVFAGTPRAQGSPVLEITAISLDPPDPSPGQEKIGVTVDYENRSDAKVTAATYRLEIWTTGDEPVPANEPEDQPVDIADGGLEPGASGSFTGYFNAPDTEATYTLKVVLLADGVESANSTTFVVKSYLPPEVARLFAVLGMFIAMMAIMAAGTEAVLAALRLPLGIAHQASAMEAFDKLRSELPGKLAAVGVSADKRKAFDKQCDAVRSTVEKAAADAGKMRDAYDAVKGGDLFAAYTALKGLKGFTGTKRKLKAELTKAKDAVKRVLDSLAASDAIKIQIPDSARASINAAIDNFEVDDALNQTGLVMGAIEKAIVQEGLAEGWLESQVDSLLSGAEGRTQDTINTAAKELEVLGFSADFISQMTAPLGDALRMAVDVAQDTSAIYVKSLGNLLEGVRKLRGMGPVLLDWFLREGQVSGAIVGVAGVTCVIVFAATSKLWPAIWGLLGAGIGIGLAALWAYAGLRKSNAPSSAISLPWLDKFVGWGWPWGGIIGGVLLLAGVVTALFGVWLAVCLTLGVAAVIVVPWASAGWRKQHVRQRSERIEVKATTVAQVLLEQEALHQREESYRVGVLKLISLIIGIALAYLLRVDAIELMEGILDPRVISTIDVAVISQWPSGDGVAEKDIIHVALTAGMILTGLAATAGSAFWHDQLDRLQNLKKQTEQGAKTIQQVRGMLVTPEEEQ